MELAVERTAHGGLVSAYGSCEVVDPERVRQICGDEGGDPAGEVFGMRSVYFNAECIYP